MQAGAEKKRAHWQAVVVSACEQSGRVRVPEVALPEPLPNYLGKLRSNELKLLLDPLAESGLDGFARPTDAKVSLLVGPEGGLSEQEIVLAGQAGFKGMRLGPRILRTETAALVALACYKLRGAIWNRSGREDRNLCSST